MAVTRMTSNTRAVLEVLLAKPKAERYGLEISKAAKLDRSAVYQVLKRLEGAEWVTGRWEGCDSASEGWPERRYYRLSRSGIQGAKNAILAASRRQSD